MMESIELEGRVGIRSDSGNYFIARISEFNKVSVPDLNMADDTLSYITSVDEYSLSKYGVNIQVFAMNYADGEVEFVVEVQGGTKFKNDFRVKGS